MVVVVGGGHWPPTDHRTVSTAQQASVSSACPLVLISVHFKLLFWSFFIGA